MTDKGDFYNKLRDMSHPTKFTRDFGKHYLEVDGPWKLYKFHDREDKICNFSFTKMQTYSCGGQTHEVAEYIHNATQMEFVRLPGGSFRMGSEKGDKNERPIRTITLDSFLMSKFVVTQQVWENIMKTKPWDDILEAPCFINKKPPCGDNYPVIYVSRDDAWQFCQKVDLCLPTETQWEYACRASTETEYYWGEKVDRKYLWYENNCTKEPYSHEVGQKKPNAFGLYDMSGNVHEYCSDNYLKGDIAIVRGGCWANCDYSVRSSFRNVAMASAPSDVVGFRVCCNL